MRNGHDKVAMLSVAIAKKTEIVLPEQEALERLWCALSRPNVLVHDRMHATITLLEEPASISIP